MFKFVGLLKEFCFQACFLLPYIEEEKLFEIIHFPIWPQKKYDLYILGGFPTLLQAISSHLVSLRKIENPSVFGRGYCFMTMDAIITETGDHSHKMNAF